MFLISKLYINSMISALFMTLCLEILSMILQRVKNIKLYLVLIIANIVTNLTMNYCLYYVSHLNYNKILLIFEISVVFIEAFVFNIIVKDYKKSLRISFINNIISWLGAYLIYYFVV